MKALLLMLIVAIVAVSVGLTIGLVVTRQTSDGHAQNRASVVSDNAQETSVVSNAVIQVPAPDLRLGTVAVADMTRLMAAHPWVGIYRARYNEDLSQIPASADKETARIMKLTAEETRRRSQKIAVRDIQRIMAEYAAAHHFTLVMDCSGNATNGIPVVLYSSDETDFEKIKKSPQVKNITWGILLELARQRSNTLLQPTAAAPGR